MAAPRISPTMPRMRQVFALAVTLAACASAPVAPKPPPDTPEARLKAAEELARQNLPPERWNAMVDMIVATQLQGMGRDGKPVPPGTEVIMRKLMYEVLSYDDLISFSARAWAAHLTAGELQELIAFYRTPAGAKSTAMAP